MRAYDAGDAAQRETVRAPADASAWERLGRLRLRRFDRRARAGARARPGAAPSEPRACSTSRWSNIQLGDVGAEVSACEQATLLAPESAVAGSRYAHALARTDRTARLPRSL